MTFLVCAGVFCTIMIAILGELADNPLGTSLKFCHCASEQTRDLCSCASGAEVLAPLTA